MSTMKDLARVLSTRMNMTQRDAEKFVNDIFELVKEALNTDGQVKIKGLGTFKLQTVRERESVDVNTGRRVIIASHDRISFTPDNMMKDAVNKPFAHFETVILNDGVSFEDTPEEDEAEIDDATASDTSVEDVPVASVIAEPEPVASVIAEPEPVVAEPAETVSEESEATTIVMQESIVEEPQTEEAPEEDDYEPDADTANEENTCEDADTVGGISWLRILGMTAACFVIFAAGVFVGRITAPQPLDEKQPLKIQVVDTLKTTAKDSVKTSEKDSLATAAKDTPKTVAKDSAKVEKTPDVETKKEETPHATPSNEKYNYDARVRTGAWVIIGTRCEHVVKQGQTLQGISRYYLGDGMECYIEVYNNNKKDVKVGDVLKIPALKNKKQIKK